jgi:hypothetical protein
MCEKFDKQTGTLITRKIQMGGNMNLRFIHTAGAINSILIRESCVTHYYETCRFLDGGKLKKTVAEKRVTLRCFLC